MSKEQQQLADTIADARVVLAELRGTQKDLKTLMRQAKAELRKSVQDHISSVVVPSLNEHNLALETAHAKAVQALAKTNSNAWKAIGRAAFGENPDPRAIGAVLCLITRAVHEVGREELLEIAAADVIDAIAAMILGTVHEFDCYEMKTFKPMVSAKDGTPHASVQDKPGTAV